MFEHIDSENYDFFSTLFSNSVDNILFASLWYFIRLIYVQNIQILDTHTECIEHFKWNYKEILIHLPPTLFRSFDSRGLVRVNEFGVLASSSSKYIFFVCCSSQEPFPSLFLLNNINCYRKEIHLQLGILFRWGFSYRFHELDLYDFRRFSHPYSVLESKKVVLFHSFERKSEWK